jgi:Fe-S-cluster containining protein
MPVSAMPRITPVPFKPALVYGSPLVVSIPVFILFIFNNINECCCYIFKQIIILLIKQIKNRKKDEKVKNNNNKNNNHFDIVK